jgi:hypothetical protein
MPDERKRAQDPMADFMKDLDEGLREAGLNTKWEEDGTLSVLPPGAESQPMSQAAPDEYKKPGLPADGVWNQEDVAAAEAAMGHDHLPPPRQMPYSPINEPVYDIGPGRPGFVKVGYMDTGEWTGPDGSRQRITRPVGRRTGRSSNKDGENQY